MEPTVALARLSFMRNTVGRVAVVVGCAALLVGAESRAQEPARAGRAWALVGGTVYVDSTAPPIVEGVVVVRDGKIASVGRKGTVSLEGLDVAAASLRVSPPTSWCSAAIRA